MMIKTPSQWEQTRMSPRRPSTTSDPVPGDHGTRRIFLPNVRASGRPNPRMERVQLGGEELECPVCGEGLTVGLRVIRVQYGTVTYRPKLRCNIFERPLDSAVQWIHWRCLLNSGVDLDLLNSDRCAIDNCGTELHDESMDSTVLEFMEGSFTHRPGEPEPWFREEGASLFAHWSCIGEAAPDFPLIVDED